MAARRAHSVACCRVAKQLVVRTITYDISWASACARVRSPRCLDQGWRQVGLRSYHASASTREAEPPDKQPVRNSGSSLFQQFRNVVQRVVKGDDFVNPKKLLERKYMYLALLASHYRTLRRQALQDGGNDDETLYERAVAELLAKDIDGMPNVDLRRALYDSLEPQVKEIFAVFQKIDDRLAIPISDNLANVDLGQFEFKDILIDEYCKAHNLLEKLQLITDEEAATRAIDFLNTKKRAMETLLSFHGWSADGYTQAAINNAIIDDFGMHVRDTNEETLQLIRKHQTINLCRSALIRQELGYSIISLKSLLPGAGRGVFLEGRVMAGSLVVFQPGDVWPKEHIINDDPELERHFEDDDDFHVSLRFDDYVVDSRQAPVTVLSQEGSINPWALGHMVNHPAAGTLPNCQSSMFNYRDSMALNDRHMKYIPNSYARVPSWQSQFFDFQPVLMHGLCLTSKRDIVNEELVYDYRLQSEETPDWYSVVTYGDGLEMDQVVFFRDDWQHK